MANILDELNGPYTEVERIEGRLMYLKGHPYPMKGIPTAEDVITANKLKLKIRQPRVLFGLIRGSRRQIDALYRNLWRGLLYEEMCPAAKGIWELIYRGYNYFYPADKSKKVADMISFIFEVDMAYRFRIQDLASSTSTPELSRRPIREIYRLMKLNEKRDNETVSWKFRYAAYGCMGLLLIPSLRKAFRYSLTVGIAPLQLDPGDRYWCSKRTDYGNNDAT